MAAPKCGRAAIEHHGARQQHGGDVQFPRAGDLAATPRLLLAFRRCLFCAFLEIQSRPWSAPGQYAVDHGEGLSHLRLPDRDRGSRCPCSMMRKPIRSVIGKPTANRFRVGAARLMTPKATLTMSIAATEGRASFSGADEHEAGEVRDLARVARG